jgi:SAM-dependent methyltransferase
LGFSSTWFDVNGDVGLGPSGKLRWVCAGLLNAARPGRGRSQVRISHPSPSWLADLPPLINEDPRQSQARLWSRAFWRRLSWIEVGSLVGPPRVIEVGCGRGDLALDLLAEAPDASYLGVDISESPMWVQREESRISFRQCRAEQLDLADWDWNVLVTQSALEHFEFDGTFLRNVADAASGKRAALLIHLVPAPMTMFLYPAHGIRQYSLGSLRRLIELFPDNAAHEVLALGGWSSNKLHATTITVPSLSGRDRRVPTLDQRLRAATRDIAGEADHAASFYAWMTGINVDPSLLTSLASW